MTHMTDGRGSALPAWVPEAARNYLAHTEAGQPIRALARASRVHASTIMRQVRRFENRRDDPLIDDVLRQLSVFLPKACGEMRKDMFDMTLQQRTDATSDAPLSELRIDREALRVLRRLVETGAVLAVARDLEMGLVVRDGPDGKPERLALVEREIAQAMALKEWISCADANARVAKYHISSVGRAALKRLMAEAENRAGGFAEAQTEFGMQHRDMGPREVVEDGLLRNLRSNLAESPLSGLARRKDRDGMPFLPRDLVAAGERLREDFELSQMGPRVTQNWDSFLTGHDKWASDASRDTGQGAGAQAARDRVAKALSDLGPGLGDVALRCCCFLEGMENLEKRMGWSARSGKIVLRIALQRLQLHYERATGKFAPKIG
jgi:hypothetical protein